MSDITESSVKGYTLRACQLAGLTKEQIKTVMGELKYLLDEVTPGEAQDIYYKSPY